MSKIPELDPCLVCPKNCGTDRYQSPGACGADYRIVINMATIHFGEEPMLSGPDAAQATSVTTDSTQGDREGSGTIFFSHCNLRCVFCQNYEISHLGWGKAFRPDEVLKVMFSLQQKGALNINLVSPTQYTPQLISILKMAKDEGLAIPIVWNSNGYEKVETLKQLQGLVDIWLPDFKYGYGVHAARYSAVRDYPAVALAAIEEMWAQSGALSTDARGIATKGMIIRHLVLPNGVSGSERIMRMIADTIGTEVTLSIMSQYYPTAKASGYAEISRSITASEYQKVLDTVQELGFSNLYIQELRVTPDWTPRFRK